MFPVRFGKALGFATAVALIIAGPALSTPAQAYEILYEALGNGGIEAFNLSNPSNPIATLNDPATNIVFGAGNVYFSSGNTVYTTNASLQGFSVFKTFGGTVESLAINPATGVLYVSGSGEIAGISLSNPSQSIGSIGDPATSMVVGPSNLYFANGNTVYTTSLGLQGLNAFNTTATSVTGLALSMASVPEPSSLILMLSGMAALGGGWLIRRRGE